MSDGEVANAQFYPVCELQSLTELRLLILVLVLVLLVLLLDLGNYLLFLFFLLVVLLALHVHFLVILVPVLLVLDKMRYILVGKKIFLSCVTCNIAIGSARLSS